MKKFLLIFLFITSYGFAQNSGITYQAVIYNPNGEELPGVNNPYAALTEQSVCLQFGIVDASGTIEYQENIQVTTDVFGMVNLLIGTYPQTSGYAASFSDINWGADAKFLKVDIDINGDCTNFKELSNQPFTYVPFAYYSPASDTPGPAGEDGNGIVNTINNTDNTITFEYTDGTSFTTDSLTGEDGGSGLSAYEVWIGLGNTGTEKEFIDSLTGEDALNSLIRTTTEEPGINCEKGGTKTEIGIDANNDGVLNDNEIDSTQTSYICNGIDGLLPDANDIGTTAYWDGTKWVVDSTNLYNDGTSVMVGDTQVDNSAALKITSSNKGILIPRLTISERNAINNPSTALLIFQTDNTPGFYYYDGTQWVNLTNSNNNNSNSGSGSGNQNQTLIYTTNGF
tara:strand:+ start:1438 stop:2628 length:1191 start_codon:yes stop_codon:yes gene_type:complete